jgi:hypothetical protein
VVLVDVVAQGVGVVELLVTLRTRVVVERDVLGHAGGTLELCIATGAGVRHCSINSGDLLLKPLLKTWVIELLQSINSAGWLTSANYTERRTTTSSGDTASPTMQCERNAVPPFVRMKSTVDNQGSREDTLDSSGAIVLTR